MLEIAVDQLTNKVPTRFEFNGESICVVRIDDEIFAVGDTCSHAEVSLSEGTVEGDRIECWLHGSRFSLKTGEPDSLPATESIPTYSVTLQGNSINISAREGLNS